jgi:hypothetical protein
MIENFICVCIGAIIGVVYHAKLQPYVSKGWAKLKAALGRIGTRKDAE